MVYVRPLEAADRARMRDGFALLSAQSRRMRFFEGINVLTEAHLDRLLNLDRVNHVAWCVVDPADPGQRGLALARYARIDEPGERIAEFALLVAEDCRREGLASLLLAVLWLEARRHGFALLRGRVLPENVILLDWLNELGCTSTLFRGEYLMDLPVDGAGLAAMTPAARRFVSLCRDVAARGGWDFRG